MSDQEEKAARDEARRLRREGKTQSSNGVEALGQAIGGVFALGFMGFVIFALGQCNAPDEPLTEDELKQLEAKRIADENAGYHCLSPWDGSHSALVESVKGTLRDPSSFEHDKTIIAPVDDNGKHTLIMRYRAKNGFGGMTQGYAQAEIDNSTCSHKLIAAE